MSSGDVEEVREKLSRVAVADDVITTITVSNWNIMGSGSAGNRKTVTTTTFETQFSNCTGSTSLGQADIICLQEMNFDPEHSAATEYLPFVKDNSHKVHSKKEAGSSKRNAIFYKEEKFKLLGTAPIENAFKLMESKHLIYDSILKGGDAKITKAVKGQLTSSDFPSFGMKICEEVLRECVQAKNIQGFHEQVSVYKLPHQDKTDSPKKILSGRMAACCLEVKSAAGCKIVVISVHNYSDAKSGKSAPHNYTRLLFDFLNKIDLPVLIAGDFNRDISSDSDKGRFHIGTYELRPLRKNRRIDFIISDLPLKDVMAHDLQVPSEISEAIKDESTVTNHNPISAVLLVKK